jgi:hypothetical protein
MTGQAAADTDSVIIRRQRDTALTKGSWPQYLAHTPQVSLSLNSVPPSLRFGAPLRCIWGKP